MGVVRSSAGSDLQLMARFVTKPFFFSYSKSLIGLRRLEAQIKSSLFLIGDDLGELPSFPAHPTMLPWCKRVIANKLLGRD